MEDITSEAYIVSCGGDSVDWSALDLYTPENERKTQLKEKSQKVKS